MDPQVLSAILASVPTMVVVLIGILINNARLNDFKSEMNTRLGDTNGRVGDLRSHMDTRFNDVNVRFDNVDRRFDEMKDLWRSELHRVEEVLDARLKHFAER